MRRIAAAWLSLAIVLIPSVALAASVEFEASYPIGQNALVASGVCQAVDGSYFIAGGAGQAALTRLSPTGELIWSVTPFPTAFFSDFFSVVPMDDGGVIATGRYRLNSSDPFHLLLVRFDADGDTLWTRLGPSRTVAFSLTRTSDDGVVAKGSWRASGTSPHITYLLKATASGDTLWSRVLPGSDVFANYPQAVIEAANGDIVGNGFDTAAGTAPQYGFAFRATSSGDLLWTTDPAGPSDVQYFAIAEDLDGTLLAGGVYLAGAPSANGYLAKLTASGDTLWTQIEESPTWALCRDPAGGFLALSSVSSPDSGVVIVVRKVDGDGNELWHRRYGSTGDDTPGNSIVSTSDGGFATGGYLAAPGDPTGLYFIKGSTSAARFDATPTSGPVPLAVQFTDRTSGSPTGWQWDLDGDGLDDATTQNPAFNYQGDGDFDVRLIALFGAARDTLIKPRFVRAGCPSRPVFPWFTDVTTAPLAALHDYVGVNWADYDADGYPDLFFSAWDTGRLFHNDGGTGFSAVALPGLPAVEGGSAWADADRDGDLDLYIAAHNAPSVLMRNDGGAFVDVATAPITNPGGISYGDAAAWGDYDNDGDPDLFVCVPFAASSLYRNDGPAGFTDVSNLGPGGESGAGGASWGDYDRDGDLDLAVSRPTGRLFRNDGGTFVDRSQAFDAPAGQGGLAWGDYDNDEDLDLFVCDASSGDRLFRNDAGAFTSVPIPSVFGDGCTWGDYDNDGDLDLFLTTHWGNALLRNDAGTFMDLTVPACSTGEFGPAVASADYNRDGRLDVIVGQWQAPSRLLRNTLGTTNHWLEVQLLGSDSDRWGIGARVTVETGATSRIQDVTAGSGRISQDDLTLHFGLGSASTVDNVTVRWPSGQIQTLVGVAADQVLQVSESGVAHDDTLTVVSATADDSHPIAVVPVVHQGGHSLGVVSLYFTYDNTKLSFLDVQSRVSGETFLAGIVGGKVSVQWIDDTQEPIPPVEDTLFVIRFTPIGASVDSSLVRFDRALSGIGDANGNPIASVLWRDSSPFGKVRVQTSSSISGRVGYFWADKDVPNAILSLGGSIPSQPSAADGTYSFPGLAVGSYTLSISKSTDLEWINALDAMKVLRHGSGVEPLGDANKEIAANVNGDGQINAFDAIKIVRASVDVEPLASGNWKFLPASRTYAPLNGTLTAQDFTAIRMGDANGDWVPSGALLLAADPGGEGAPLPASGRAAPGTAGSGPTPTAEDVATATPGVALPYMLVAPGGPPVDVPLSVTGFTGIGAVSLRITFVDSVLAYTSLTSNVGGVSFTSNLVGSEIRAEWYDASGGANPINLGSGTLLTLHFNPVGSDGDLSALHFKATSALGDAAGNPIGGASFQDGLLGIRLVTEVEPPHRPPARFALGPNVPNPVAGRTTFRLELPEAAAMRLRVFDVAGKLVETVADGWMSAGAHEIEWRPGTGRGARVAPGLYFARLEAGGRFAARKLLVVH